jgi:hypothetical protein
MNVWQYCIVNPSRSNINSPKTSLPKVFFARRISRGNGGALPILFDKHLSAIYSGDFPGSFTKYLWV